MVVLAIYSLLIPVIQRATVLVGLSTVLFGKLKNCPNVLTREISAKIGNGITTNWLMLDLHQHGMVLIKVMQSMHSFQPAADILDIFVIK